MPARADRLVAAWQATRKATVAQISTALGNLNQKL